MLSFYPSVKEKSQSKIVFITSQIFDGYVTISADQSIVTLVMLPNSPEKRTLTSTLLTSQLTALKDFSSLRRARVYSLSSLSSHSNSTGTGTYAHTDTV